MTTYDGIIMCLDSEESEIHNNGHTEAESLSRKFSLYPRSGQQSVVMVRYIGLHATAPNLTVSGFLA